MYGDRFKLGEMHYAPGKKDRLVFLRPPSADRIGITLHANPHATHTPPVYKKDWLTSICNVFLNSKEVGFGEHDISDDVRVLDVRVFWKNIAEMCQANPPWLKDATQVQVFLVSESGEEPIDYIENEVFAEPDKTTSVIFSRSHHKRKKETKVK